MPKKHDPKKRERKDGMPKKHDPKKIERKDGMPKKHDPANKVRHEKEHVIICALAQSVRKYKYQPMDPIFDLATDLSQADAFLLCQPNSTYAIHDSMVEYR